MTTMTNVREISKIAYGFMGTQALVAALDIDLFGALRDGPMTCGALAKRVGVRSDRLQMLLTPLVALGLLVMKKETYANAPASAKYLDPTTPEFFGEYIRLQVGKQIYPHASKIGDALRGAPINIYTEVAANDAEAAAFSHSQHIGSLGPAYLTARRVEFDAPGRLLDIAGGSGAFTIALCQKYPNLHATILDFPAITPVARNYVSKAKLEEQVDYIEANALECAWPDNQDIVVMSYLLSAVGKDDIPKLLSKAYNALQPGGKLVLHDFMVGEDLSGPLSAALWMLVLVSSQDPVALTAAYLQAQAEAEGFTSVWHDDLVPSTTKVLVATK